MWKLILAGAATLVTAAAAAEQPEWQTCATNIHGKTVQLSFKADENFYDHVGWTERKFSGWGSVTCPGPITLKHILQVNDVEGIGDYCLLWDRENDTYVGAQAGARGGNAVCKKTLCQRVNGDVSLAEVGGAAAAGAIGAGNLVMAATGTTVVAHSSGALIMTGASGYIAGTLGTAATAGTAIITAPATLAAVAAGAAAYGGAVWYCSGK